MDATRRIFIRNAESRAEREKRGLLAVSNPLFCPCGIEEAENGFFFCFVTEEDWQDFAAAAALETEEKFRLLANCAALEAARAHYYFALSPDNLVFDRNLCPRILVRDAAAEADMKEDFFRAYRALAASLLSERHTYEDFLAGGERLFRAEKQLAGLARQTDSKELSVYFSAQWESRKKRRWEKTVQVSRQRLLLCRIALPLLSIALLALAGSFFYWYRIRFRKAERLIAAAEAYLREDYLAVGEALRGMKPGELSAEGRYMLARASIFTEGLTPVQREHILAGLHPKSDEETLRFWIYIGQNRFPEALDAAKRRGDEEMQLYALLKEESVLAGDRTKSGQEKEAEERRIEAEIETLRKKMQPEQEETNETLSVPAE